MLTPDRHLSITPYLVLEHGSVKHRQMALDHLVTGLLEFATNEQGSKSVTKALKEGGKETLDKFVKRMAESTKGYRGVFYFQCRPFVRSYVSVAVAAEPSLLTWRCPLLGAS
jgi:hypothetical protein